jgi:outer membrane receptor for ferrienterochelin and colicins
MRLKLVVLACASSLVGVGVHAEAKAQAQAEDNRIAQLRTMSLADVLQVDISTGTSKLIHQAPGVAYVITAPDIARMGARNMQEVLESIPGFNVYLYQSLVNSPIVDMRGLLSERGGYILFLRDGRPLRLLSNNTMPEVFQLPVHFIERIEVVRGPASAVYGPDALAAAVNIITRSRPDEAGVRVGDNDATAGWAGISGKLSMFEWSVAASTSRYNIEAVTRRRQPPREFTQDFGQNYADVDAKVSAGPFRVSLWALNYHKEETGNPANPRGFTDVRTRHRHADVEYAANLGATTELKADLFYTYFRGTRQNELVMGQPTNGDNGEERTTANVTFTETRFASHRLRANAGFMRERRGNYLAPPPPPPGAPPPPPPQPSSRDVSFASVQDEFAFRADWELTAGIRVDRYDDLGSIYSPRAGLVWTIDPTLTAKLLQSSGFRAPGPALTNTTSTRPEEAKNLELAFDYRPNERWRAVANAYRYSANNLTVAGGPTAVPVSREGKGGEVEISWLASQAFKLETSLATVSAKDRRTDARAPYTPRTSAKVSANWRPRDDWTWHVRWEGYWDIARPANDPRPALQDFQLVHATVRHEFNRNISALFAVHNLFDKRTYIPVLSGANMDDYQLAPRNLSLQVEVRF